MTFDLDLLQAINGASGNPVLDAFMILGAMLGEFYMIAALGAAFIMERRSRPLAIVWLVAISLAGIIVLIVKPAVARPRPFIELGWVRTVWDMPGSYSFPSGHATTASAGCTAAILFLAHRLKMREMRISVFCAWAIALFLLAAWSSVGRIYLGVHYPSDVLAGAGIGVIAGAAVFAAYVKRHAILRAFKKAIP
ncbi:MAG: hypothetical protein CVT48_03020 [Thermoplasmata archaeon HGW-Thermoplasmata-1]|nr:MAG: hypothetical protein CVT48_03020 [Thermoplasmata archaeon HGW-Thermoplasmata-1]